MGILAPLYLAGLAALAVPLVLHLVRRTPRGRQVFSSLMFLSPSPPRLTRRSRLDQILLLLLRLAALALLALAFSRPFLREAASLSLDHMPGRKVAILVDTSASLRRGDLWQQAQRLAEIEIDDLNPQDDVALFAFHDRLETLVDFERKTGRAPAGKADVVRQKIRALRPGWGGTDLGGALVRLAGELEVLADQAESDPQPLIVAIGDFQQGSRLDKLQSYAWPEKVRVVPRAVTLRQTTNAYAHLLQSAEDESDAELRVRVVSAADSSADQFFVAWEQGDEIRSRNKSESKLKAVGEVAVYVPPGQSRVVKLPRPELALQSDRLLLWGDDHEFDNTHYVVAPEKRVVRLLYVGADAADDAQGLQYYLRLAVAGDPLRQVEVVPLAGEDSLGEPAPELVVVSRAVSSALRAMLVDYVEQGGTLLIAPANREAAAAIPALVEVVTLAVVENAAAQSSGEEYLLLGEIDFTHPLFVPFANPRYSDFTKIHFWRHWPIKALTSGQGDEGATNGRGYAVVARFDNGDPAILEQTWGKGRVIALATSWRPEDSQLALSSKFVPLVGGLIDLASGTPATLAGAVVHAPVALAQAGDSAESVVHKPDGKQIKLSAGATAFDQTDQPGIYRLQAGEETLEFAVNLAAAESDTAPLDVQRLEQLGVQLGADLSRAQRLAKIRQARETELESHQKAWRWLIVACLGVLIAETWWAGRAGRVLDRKQESES
ncbi:MAG: BatA domain-containing protein [Pirellulaceae bacterium]